MSCSPRWHRHLPLLLLLAAPLGCSKDRAPTPPSTAPAAAEAPPPAALPSTAPAAPAPRPAPPPGVGGRIAVDISASMRGFAAAKKSTQFHKVLGAVSSALARVEAAAPLEHCRVSKGVECTADSSGLALESPKNYRAKEARLDLVVRPTPAPADPREVRPPDALDARKVTVLLTDGMLSTWSKPAGPGQAGCTAGVDLSCLSNLLRGRVQEGYGVWLAMVLLPFQGMHYAEKKLEPADARRLKEHIEAAKKLRPWASLPLKVGKVQSVGTAGTSGYAYAGLKPLLLFVLSRDVGAGRRFVGHLRGELGAAHVAEPGDDRFHFAELSPTEAPGLRVQDIARTGPPSDALRLGQIQQRGDAYLVPIRCSHEGQAVLNVEHARVAPPLGTWPDHVEVSDEVAALEPPPVGFEGPLPAGPNRHAWRISCNKLRAGETRVPYGYRTSLRPRAEPGAVWWSTFSARNTYEEPEKVYSLRELVSAVLEPRIRRELPGPRIFFAVQRQ